MELYKKYFFFHGTQSGETGYGVNPQFLPNFHIICHKNLSQSEIRQFTNFYIIDILSFFFFFFFFF
jgi:hypothetical protein